MIQEKKNTLCIRITPGWVNTPMTEFSYLGELSLYVWPPKKKNRVLMTSATHTSQCKNYTGQEIFPHGLNLFQKVYKVHNVVKDITGTQETKSCVQMSQTSPLKEILYINIQFF